MIEIYLLHKSPSKEFVSKQEILKIPTICHLCEIWSCFEYDTRTSSNKPTEVACKGCGTITLIHTDKEAFKINSNE